MEGKSKLWTIISIVVVVFFFVFLSVLEYLPIVSRFIGFLGLFSNKVKVLSPDVDHHGPTGYSDKKKSNQIKLFKLDNAQSPEPEAHAHRWEASALTTAPALLPG